MQENKLMLTNIMNPQKIEDIVGHKELLDKNNGLITKMIKNNTIYSFILYGPPGIGKSSIVRVIAKELKMNIIIFDPTKDQKNKLINCVESSIKEKNKIIVIIDEIHRLNKDKQDILLSYLETEKIILLATTTENPYFTVNPAIRSRLLIFPLKKPSKKEIKNHLEIFIKEKLKWKINSQILDKIVYISNGDLRSAINILDVIKKLYKEEEISVDLLEKIFPFSTTNLGKFGDEFHDLKSAFHKSIRGSDPDAAIYYLARLLKSNDLVSIKRRILAAAYEDIGLANPNLIQRAYIAVQTAIELGLPEAKQVLSTIVIEMCLSPKSNSSYIAIKNAINEIELNGTHQIPLHIRDQSYKSAQKLGIKGYLYPHDYGGYVKQDYLPKELKNKKFYLPNKNAPIEKKMYEYWKNNNDN